MTYRGHIEAGRVVLDDTLSLPDGTIVTVQPAPVEEEREAAGSTLYDRLRGIIGIAPSLGPDASTTVDDVLYHGRQP